MILKCYYFVYKGIVLARFPKAGGRDSTQLIIDLKGKGAIKVSFSCLLLPRIVLGLFKSLLAFLFFEFISHSERPEISDVNHASAFYATSSIWIFFLCHWSSFVCSDSENFDSGVKRTVPQISNSNLEVKEEITFKEAGVRPVIDRLY